MKDPMRMAKAQELRKQAEAQLKSALVMEEIGEKDAANQNLEAAADTELKAIQEQLLAG